MYLFRRILVNRCFDQYVSYILNLMSCRESLNRQVRYFSFLQTSLFPVCKGSPQGHCRSPLTIVLIPLALRGRRGGSAVCLSGTNLLHKPGYFFVPQGFSSRSRADLQGSVYTTLHLHLHPGRQFITSRYPFLQTQARVAPMPDMLLYGENIRDDETPNAPNSKSQPS